MFTAYKALFQLAIYADNFSFRTNINRCREFRYGIFIQNIWRFRNQDINPIHLIFGILTDKDTEPFIIVEDDVKEGQTNFKKAKKDLKAGRQCYVTSVNIEKLLEDEANGGVKEIPIKCHIKKTEGAVSCFTYELKLRLN